MPKNYTLRDFDFELPERLIAQTPASPRDHARLLVYDRKTKTITDDYFYNLEKYLPAKSTLVVNNSRVEKCRMQFGKVEIFVLETINPTTITALVRPGRKFGLGEVIIEGFKFTVDAIAEDGIRTIRLDRTLDDQSFDPHRLTPLPPYIAQDESLAEEYQTVYADPLGSKAAPTAGLHFTPELLTNIKKTHDFAEVTLHVGMGTFAPVKTDEIKDHIMHEEHYSVTSEVAAKLNAAIHTVAVGTTTVRVLESAQRPFAEEEGSTAIFITPGYEFKAVASLITNFHLPKSTLLMLVSAFLGSVEELHKIYEHAVKENYRFYSFGDAMFIL
ncbi:MAG: S-adenosylmethionine--tRNA ribosyltransferase-isomerase [Candidatus Saccharibacteria bacterium]|nr:S-adenosylmethionine--tRNA ribosyltransferase-isomerase [Candidatus Saccharibacteria bacterium]